MNPAKLGDGICVKLFSSFWLRILNCLTFVDSFIFFIFIFFIVVIFFYFSIIIVIFFTYFFINGICFFINSKATSSFTDSSSVKNSSFSKSPI
ncbi:hypothetical protein LJK87_27705 [Paenibacillus sp. P25]|nr:hypothetical protein LJK87_27705 [Paenibacillus sp. P25]